MTQNYSLPHGLSHGLRYGLIDTHCHLNYDYLPKTEDDLVREAHEAGVEKLITIGTDLASFESVQRISEKFDSVYHTIGVHPHESISLKEGDLEVIERAARHSKCKAIGEIGLDYHYDHSPRDVQKKWCELQLNLALKLGLPIVVHSREGEEDLLILLREYASKVPEGNIPGVIHCFTGTLPFGRECLKLGFYISFSGILSFKKAEEVQMAAREFPLERILVETDSPYLAPIPFRGKKCEPSMVKWTAQKLAELKGLSFEEISRATYENAKRVFKI